MMVQEKDEKPLDLSVIDKWLETFFLDPLTSYLDETTFRIDLFETAEEFIVEALLQNYHAEEIEVLLKEDAVWIQAGKSNPKVESKSRKIPFPFPIINHEVTASFSSGILEVFISKHTVCKGENRVVELSS
ncbi:Hsp20/alpha crystallin family protein [Niallia oryzisoli]|uniref:Hsp20/alpha crystallin family protein n=1 Tax=Niallia oryzisoli TaxID=1737571 RepID=A0ABZ2CNY5_9BACI